jgi:hypothetical protein
VRTSGRPKCRMHWRRPVMCSGRIDRLR